MKKLIYLLCFISTAAYGQNTFKARVIDADTKAPLFGATAQISPTKGAIADENGYLEIKGISTNTIELLVSYVGYERFVKTYTLPISDTVVIAMEHEHDDHDEVIVTSNRSSRTIDEIPTRIEVLASEELEEKSMMRSNNIAMLLRESTGILMQMTSASAANQSIRIQGLDGRHTQLLRDGFPVYSGFSSALSIMQIPPLDLKQVEVLKGSNSTLFGGGAIAGLVNLVSITPGDERKLKFMLDQTNASGTTANGFYAEKFKNFGLTLYGSVNRQQAYDANGDDFSDIPQIRSWTFNPSFFFYLNDKDLLRISFNLSSEERFGGDIPSIEDADNHTGHYTELNETDRISYQITYENKIDDRKTFTAKHSLNYFDRSVMSLGRGFDGQQWSTFTELSYRINSEASSWIAGMNVYSDSFKESNQVFGNPSRDYDYLTFGTFVQNTTTLSPAFTLESGFRADFDTNFGNFFLPRASLLAKINEKWTARLGGGLGYKLPTMFIEEAETIQYDGVMPIDVGNMEEERSIGGNLDFNYKTAIGDNWTFSLNQLFFYTQLTDAVVLRNNGSDIFNFENADGPINSKGIETNLKLTYNDFKLFANYALIDTELKFDNINQQKPLTPKHNIGLVLMYEEHGKWRVGLEAYYKSRQLRNNFTETDDFWIAGFMVMRKWKNFGLYVNFENFTDTRQHSMENFNINDHISPNFPDIWAPIDGYIMNGGIILEF